MSEIVKGILRAVSTGLQIPTIIILILLILLTIFMLGTFFAEMLTERKSLKLNIPKLVDELQGKSTSEMKDIVASSSLLTRQKAAAQELISRVTYPDDTREALARQLIADEESRYNRIIKITDLTARVAPMFGLMGTLIPLGPGLIALSEGDAATLSSSILIAFDRCGQNRTDRFQKYRCNEQRADAADTRPETGTAGSSGTSGETGSSGTGSASTGTAGTTGKTGSTGTGSARSAGKTCSAAADKRRQTGSASAAHEGRADHS